MGFRMRKSIKVAPGVRVNVSKGGVGASVGGKGGRASVHSSGRRTVSAGSGVIPGVYYQKSVSGQESQAPYGQAVFAQPCAPIRCLGRQMLGRCGPGVVSGSRQP
jgi:Protein of unknown function (DUF4236)